MEKRRFFGLQKSQPERSIHNDEKYFDENWKNPFEDNKE